MGTPESSREPFPDRILDDIGGAFGMGAVGGSAFHFLEGIYNSPDGDRLAGAAQAVRTNAPRVGGSFAVWGGLFSVFEGAGIMLNRILSVPQNLPALEDPALGLPSNVAIAMGGFGPSVSDGETSGSSSSNWFGGFFGLGKQVESKSGGAMAEVLESFDSASAPIPNFVYK